MSARRSSATSNNHAHGGFTLPEVLVCFALAGIVALAVFTAYVFVTRSWAEHQARLGTQQQMRTAVAALSREVRLAGACIMLPSGSTPPTNFQPVSGIDSGTTDSITVRSNPRCLTASLSGSYSAGDPTISVQSATGFTGGMHAYILRSDSDPELGEAFTIQSVTATTIVPTAPLSRDYPATASAVFGFDQRTFAISSVCGGCGGIPTLTLQTLDVPGATPLVKGIDRLDIHYILNTDYVPGPYCVTSTGGTRPLCVVNLPAAGDWKYVRAITFDLGAVSLRPVRADAPDGFFHLGEIFEISPRNFTFSTRL